MFSKSAKSLICTVLAFFFVLSAADSYAQLLAFPGAEGGGRFAVGGRGSTVYEVSNLNDAGAGSLRDAISQPNRTIVFRVSGIIRLASKLTIKNNNLTIAGQTAPGDGIMITGYTVNISASNVVIRYIRCRLSDVNDIEDDAMNGFTGSVNFPYHDIIIDHCSLGWSVDETGTFYGLKNFTLQWCLLTESLYNSVHNKGVHGYGGIWGGQNATFHHNLLAHHTSRNPRFCGSRYTGRPDLEVVDFRNNVLYNCGNINSAYGGEDGNYNMVNNYYKPGPATPGSLTISSASNKRNRILNYTSYYYSSDAAIYPDTVWGGKFYIDGNYIDGYPDVSADNWTKGVQKDGYARADSLMHAARQNAPFTTAPVTTQTAQDAYLSVLDGVGAVLPRRDALDARVVNEVRTGTATYEGATYAQVTGEGISHPSGIIDTPGDVGGLPVYQSTTAPLDTDHDGMPDDWETAHGLNPGNAADGNNVAGNGYTNLENYINSTTSTPTIAVSGGLSNFSQSLGSPSGTKQYTVTGSNLTDNITITPPANYQISVNNGITWTSGPLTLSQASGSVANTIVSVRLNANATGSYSGNITHTSNSAGSVNIHVSGNTFATAPAGTNAVVAQDGTGDFATVQAAINAAPANQTAPYIIYIKNGKYKEKVSIPSNKPFIHLVGESVANTIITWDDYSGKVVNGVTLGTSNSATITISASDCMAMNLTFENSTGYTGDGPQALAINVAGDRCAFKNCRFVGGQDTVLANGDGKRQYFKNCYIDGNTDFIFGSSTVVFDSCVVYPRDRVDGSAGGYITAANTPPGQAYGYVFRNCKITVNRGVTKYTLGRPWQNDANTADAAKKNNKVVFLNTTMGNSIKPEGWSVWDAGTNTSLINYAEYRSRNFDSSLVDVSQRVSWSMQLNSKDAATYNNNAAVLGGWDPCTLSALLCPGSPSDIAVSNFKAKKGTTTTPTFISWNISWPIAGITYELFRSTDKVSFAKINEQTSLNDTAVNFVYAEPMPPAGNIYYYYLKASKDGFASHITDTIQISTNPVINITGSTSAFVQQLGTPSAAQAYTVSGANLANDIIISPPAGYEISETNGTTWTNAAITLTQSGNAVPNTTLSVRLNAANTGTYAGNILHESTGAVSVNVPVTGTVTSDMSSLPSVLLQHWPLASNSTDSANVRSPAVMPTSPVFSKFALADSVVAPYGDVTGQSFAPTSRGYWITGSPAFGPGGNLNRTFYEEFTVTAAAGRILRLDSILLKSAFISTNSNTKLAVVYSKTRFTTSDSTNVTGGISIMPPVAATPMLSTANGGFTTPVLLANQGTTGTTNEYHFAFNSANGVSLAPGQTLAIRLYYSCGSTSLGRYAMLKDVMIKGVASDINVLPLNLITFNGQNESGLAKLTWISANEVNTNYFIVERSTDGRSFSEIGKVTAKNTTGEITYNFSDPIKLVDAVFYRLKIVDRDDNFKYSNMILITVKASTISVHPNPAHRELIVTHPKIKSAATITIYNAGGMKIKTVTLALNSIRTTVNIASFAKGNYIVILANGKETSGLQFIKD